MLQKMPCLKAKGQSDLNSDLDIFFGRTMKIFTKLLLMIKKKEKLRNSIRPTV